MPFIELGEGHLPGITGLLEYRKDSAQPIRELTQFLLRGPNTLTEAERELIATVVSSGNECTFCTTARRITRAGRGVKYEPASIGGCQSIHFAAVVRETEQAIVL